MTEPEGAPRKRRKSKYDPTCTVAGCDKAHKAKGLCTMHYWRVRANGAIEPKQPRYSTPEEAFAARTKASNGGCTEWTGSISGKGYGALSVNRKSVYAHRYAWERVNGPIPDGLFVDHMCHNRACVNVEHLRLATNSQNLQNKSPTVKKVGKSGFLGVHWHTGMGRWIVRITVDGKAHGTGRSYESKYEAKEDADKLRAELMPYWQG